MNDFTTAFAINISGDIFIRAVLRSASSRAFLNSFNLSLFAMNEASEESQTSILLVFSFCCFARFFTAFDVLIYGIRKQSASIINNPVPIRKIINIFIIIRPPPTS